MFIMYRSKRKRSYDPVDYESIDKTEFWVVEEEEAGELEYDELENALAEEYPKDLEDTNPEKSNGILNVLLKLFELTFSCI